MKKGILRFLGTGGSFGVPVVACSCRVCSCSDAKNKRLRSSVLLSLEEGQVLVDAGPDFREQALRSNLKHLDALWITHAHFDHMGGLDDLRAFERSLHQGPLPAFASQETWDALQKNHPHFFTPHKVPGGFYQEGRFSPVTLEKESGSTKICGATWHHISYHQKGMKVSGFRIGDLAYLIDIKESTPLIEQEIQGVKIAVVSALREGKSEGHFSVEEAINFGKKMGIQRTILSHISHAIDHEHLSKTLPEGVELAYDGLEVFFGYN